MKSILRTRPMVGLLVLCFAAASAFADDELATQVDIPYEMFQLDNGLTVLVHSDHSTPTVFVGLWYGVGSKDEPEGKTGFAHLFEHLMFQGTENREGEYFSPFMDAGATGMNGTTAEDRTNYYATVPTGALDMALWMESDRMTYLLGAVTQEALDEQRGVVQNEKRQGETRPYAGMYDRIRAGLYPVDHPYRHSIIGSMEDLEAASLDDVHEWFNTYYGASNAVLVLAGDVTVEHAQEKVEFYFSEAPAGEPLTHPEQWIPVLDENRHESMYDRVGQTRISRNWALPGLNDRDTLLMYLVNETLVSNKNAPLYKALVDDLRLATNVRGYAHGRVLSGEYNLTIDLLPGVDPDEAMAVVDQVIEEYLEEGPDEELLENAKLAVNMYMIGALETTSSIGRLLIEGYLYSDDPLFINTQLAWLNEASEDDLSETANRWLRRGFYELTVLPFPEYTVAEAQADRSTIPSVTVDADLEFPEIETVMLDNGMRLVVAERGNIPIVDVTVRLDTGAAAAPLEAPGLANFVFGLLPRGTERYDANELAAARDRIAMGGSFSTRLENTTFSYRILNSNLDDSLELTAEMLRNPTFPDEELDKMKEEVAAWLSTLEQAPASAAASLFDRAVFGDDNAMGAVWSREYLEQVDTDMLAEFHAREVAPDNMTIFMIGDIDIDTAQEAVEDAFGRWRDAHQSARAPVGSALEARPRVILIDYEDAESSTIVAGHALPPFDRELSTEVFLVNQVIGGGFESRLNMNLREDKAWSYGYGSGVASNQSGDQMFRTRGSVQTDRTADAMAEIMRELSEYVTTAPATEREVERIKIKQIRSLPGQYTTNRGFLSSIVYSDSYGLPFDYAETRGDRIEAVTLDQINARAQAYLDPSHLTWVVVGDLDRIEESVRALNYGDVEVWDAFGNRLR